ncbi:hypothetical protein [Devosia sp.]|jgi:hypothetical protein|uniref:hypothetical protein n=1 Tax=Devosia sp. TaxID=1871048 RepID=UPI001ACD0F57|nr:hypothetical protein [Devosia sp.]MBN9362980.1 hypothetical protein [Devosia sp.]
MMVVSRKALRPGIQWRSPFHRPELGAQQSAFSSATQWPSLTDWSKQRHAQCRFNNRANAAKPRFSGGKAVAQVGSISHAGD